MNTIILISMFGYPRNVIYVSLLIFISQFKQSKYTRGIQRQQEHNTISGCQWQRPSSEVIPGCLGSSNLSFYCKYGTGKMHWKLLLSQSLCLLSHQILLAQPEIVFVQYQTHHIGRLSLCCERCWVSWPPEERDLIWDQ